jgi:hypothetical protein
VSEQLSPDRQIQHLLLIFVHHSTGNWFTSTFEAGNLAANCDVSGKFAILLHGFNEDCNHPYMMTLFANLRAWRGGCIICMDFSKYTRNYPYLKLISEHNGILAVLTKKLRQFRDEGFDPKKGYMFGFSFGSILAINGALETFGKRVFGLIDGKRFRYDNDIFFITVFQLLQLVTQLGFSLMTPRLLQKMRLKPPSMCSASILRSNWALGCGLAPRIG